MKKSKQQRLLRCEARPQLRKLAKSCAPQPKATAHALSAELPAWPSLGQLRERMPCRCRSQPECPYRFDASL